MHHGKDVSYDEQVVHLASCYAMACEWQRTDWQQLSVSGWEARAEGAPGEQPLIIHG